MKVFCWDPGFQPDVESSIAPVWISIPNLPLFLFDKSCLLSIGHLIGKPLTIDNATADLSRPSVARIWAKVDLLKKLPHRIWLECGDSLLGFWQEIIMKNYQAIASTIEVGAWHFCMQKSQPSDEDCPQKGSKEKSPVIAPVYKPKSSQTTPEMDVPSGSITNQKKQQAPLWKQKEWVQKDSATQEARKDSPQEQKKSFPKAQDVPKATTSNHAFTTSEEQATANPNVEQVSRPTLLHASFDDLHLNCKVGGHNWKKDEDCIKINNFTLATPKGPRVTTLDNILFLQKNFKSYDLISDNDFMEEAQLEPSNNYVDLEQKKFKGEW